MKEILELWHLAVGLASIAIVGIYKFATQKAKTDSEIENLKTEIVYLKKSNESRSQEITKLENSFLTGMEKMNSVMNEILSEIKLLKHVTKINE